MGQFWTVWIIHSEEQLQFIKGQKKIIETQSYELILFNAASLLKVLFTAVPKVEITLSWVSKRKGPATLSAAKDPAINGDLFLLHIWKVVIPEGAEIESQYYLV